MCETLNRYCIANIKQDTRFKYFNGGFTLWQILNTVQALTVLYKR